VFERTFCALAACCAVLPLTAAAQSRSDGEEEGEKKPLAELEVKLPPMPKSENLLPFEPSAASNNRFYIDAASIDIGVDGIVRYTLVIKGPGGGSNISYEGIRCSTIEQKTYAFGRGGGTWVNSRTSEWRQIVYKSINRQHGVLYADYLCPDGSPIRSAAEAIRRFKYGVPPGQTPRFDSVH
jgi:hypothetical protein